MIKSKLHALWARIRHAAFILDASFDYDPHEEHRRRLDALDQRLKAVEKGLAPANGAGESVR